MKIFIWFIINFRLLTATYIRFENCFNQKFTLFKCHLLILFYLCFLIIFFVYINLTRNSITKWIAIKKNIQFMWIYELNLFYDLNINAFSSLCFVWIIHKWHHIWNWPYYQLNQENLKTIKMTIIHINHSLICFFVYALLIQSFLWLL